MLRMRWQAGIVNARHSRMSRQHLGDSHRAGALCLVAYEVSFESTQYEVRRVRIECAAERAPIGSHATNQLGAPDHLVDICQTPEQAYEDGFFTRLAADVNWRVGR